MPLVAPNFIWHKSATRAWLRDHESALSEKTSGAHAVVEVPRSERLRVEFFCETLHAAEALRAQFAGSIRRLPIDWEAQWFSAHRTKRLRIGSRLTVQSESLPTPSEQALVIPAGLAFGTGEHATTAMSLRILERISRKQALGWRMFDAGTGSGILALAGARFGAGKVIAIDNDKRAIATAKYNARTNGIDAVTFRVGDVTRGLRGRFDIITANLYAELLKKVLPNFAAALRENGWLILSGVLRGQERALVRALERNGFGISETRRRGKWIAVAATPLGGEKHC